jgi:hypothetical protein
MTEMHKMDLKAAKIKSKLNKGILVYYFNLFLPLLLA